MGEKKKNSDWKTRVAVEIYGRWCLFTFFLACVQSYRSYEVVRVRFPGFDTLGRWGASMIGATHRPGDENDDSLFNDKVEKENIEKSLYVDGRNFMVFWYSDCYFHSINFRKRVGNYTWDEPGVLITIWWSWLTFSRFVELWFCSNNSAETAVSILAYADLGN